MRKIMRKIILSVVCLLLVAVGVAQDNLTNGRACYKVGLMRLSDPTAYNYNEAPRYFSEALASLQAAAKEGYGEACYLLGNMYNYAYGTEQNFMLAMRMYQRGLEFGYNEGEAELGRMYEKGEGCTADSQKAFEYFQKSADKKIVYGQYQLMLHYYYGEETEANNAKVFELLKILEKASYKPEEEWMKNAVYYILGVCYESGSGTAINLEEAVRNYIKSDDSGSLFNAALLIDKHELRVTLDPNGSTYLRTHNFKRYDVLQKAFEKGYKQAHGYYLRAIWGKEDYDGGNYEGNKENWFSSMLQSAEMNFGPAQKMIGDWYKEGFGTPKNLMKSNEWYAKAKANGEEIPE